MKGNESYFPLFVDRGVELIKAKGISIRDKLAQSFLQSLLSNPAKTNTYTTEGLLNQAFELADLFIKKSQENGN